MGTDDAVTPAHLDAVRREMDAKIEQHRAEVHGTLKELAAEFRASRQDQAHEYVAIRGSVDHLTQQVTKVAALVDKLEDGDEKTAAVNKALDAFTAKLGKRAAWFSMFLVGVVSAAIAAFT